MSNPQIIVPGIDLSVIVSPTPAQIDQAIRTSYPPTNIGGIVLASLAPDTVTYPLLAGFIWSETVDDIDYVPTGNIYTFNGVTWVLHQTSNGADIDNGSITFDKLAVPGAPDALKIMRANVGGTGYELVPVLSTIDAGTFPLNKLVPGANNTMLIVNGSGTVTWVDSNGLIDARVSAAIVAAINALTIPISKILPGTGAVGQVLGLYLDGATVKTYWVYPDALIRDHTITAAKLNPEASHGGDLLQVNPGSTAFDYVDPRALMDSLTAFGSISQAGAYSSFTGDDLVPVLDYVVDGTNYQTTTDLAGGTITITVSGKYIVTYSFNGPITGPSAPYDLGAGIRINADLTYPVDAPPTWLGANSHGAPTTFPAGATYMLDLVAGDTVSLMVNADLIAQPSSYDSPVANTAALSITTL